MEAVVEVEVEEEQEEVEQEVEAVEEEAEEAEAHRVGHQQQLATPVDRPGSSVQEETEAQDFWVASLSLSYLLLSSRKNSLLRYSTLSLYTDPSS